MLSPLEASLNFQSPKMNFDTLAVQLRTKRWMPWLVTMMASPPSTDHSTKFPDRTGDDFVDKSLSDASENKDCTSKWSSILSTTSKLSRN